MGRVGWPVIAEQRHIDQAFRWLRQPEWPRDPEILKADTHNPHRIRLVEIYAEQLARAEQRVTRCTDLKRAAAGDLDH